MSSGINLCEECDFNTRVPGTPHCHDCAVYLADDYDSDVWIDDQDLDDPPLYPNDALQKMTEEMLQKEWSRQCSIHDHGVDNYEMGHSVIETAQSRLNLVEREQELRGFEKGPARND